MKKGRGFLTSLSVFIMSLLLLIAPVTALAASGEYFISNIVIDASVNEQGDMLIEEHYQYVFKGSFNGIKRNIKTKGSDGVSDVSVEVQSNNNTEKGDFELNRSGSETEVKIYSKSKNETKNFIIKYRIKNVVTKYSDLAELKWLFYENEADVDTGRITVYLALPHAITSEVKYTGEGPRRGVASLEDENRMKFQLEDMRDGEVIGAHVLFPPSWVNTAKRIDMNMNAYNEMKKRETVKTVSIIFVSIASILGLIFTLIYRSYKKTREAVEEYRRNYIFFNERYYSQLPSNLSPALVSRLMDNKTENKDLLATILYLANKGAITFLEDGIQEKNYNNLRFTINYYIGMDELSRSERFLLNWLSEYSSNGCIQLSTFKKKAGKAEFIRKYDNWKNMIGQEANSLNFYANVRGKQILTNEYEDERRKWAAFRNYLRNSGVEQRVYLEEQGLWERIVPYAVVLDAVEPVLQYMKNNDHYSYSTNNVFMNYWFLHYYTSTYRRDFDTSYHNNVSSSSGGNFSGGSGGGFGGGGGSSAF